MDTDTHTLQKIRYLDEQLSATELSEAEQELTSRHRLGMLQQRSVRSRWQHPVQS